MAAEEGCLAAPGEERWLNSPFRMRPVRGPGLQRFLIFQEILQAACRHAASHLFFNGVKGAIRHSELISFLT